MCPFAYDGSLCVQLEIKDHAVMGRLMEVDALLPATRAIDSVLTNMMWVQVMRENMSAMKKPVREKDKKKKTKE